MCSERRATFQRTSMDDNGSITAFYSINLSRMQMIVTILVGFVTLIGSFVIAARWARGSILEAVEQNFHTAADEYYAQVIPERNQYYRDLLQAELLKFKVENAQPVEARLTNCFERVTVLETQNSNIVKRLDRHEELLLEILRRLPED